MKWLKSKKWLVCLLCALFVMTPVLNTGWAEPEEEEEELLQPRPNPMDRTGFQNQPNPADKTNLNTRTGISGQSGAPVGWDPTDKNPSSHGISGQSGAPVSWDPFDKNPSHGKQLVPGQSLRNNMPTSGKKTGTTMMEGASGVNPGGAVGKVVGDDIVNPTKKPSKAMMGGQITK
jgi:hypothetical protein